MSRFWEIVFCVLLLLKEWSHNGCVFFNMHAHNMGFFGIVHRLLFHLGCFSTLLCHHTGILASQENQSTVFVVEQQILWSSHAHMWIENKNCCSPAPHGLVCTGGVSKYCLENQIYSPWWRDICHHGYWSCTSRRSIDQQPLKWTMVCPFWVSWDFWE